MTAPYARDARDAPPTDDVDASGAREAADAPGARPVALCLSPHLDDAAFSCGGTLARLAAAGWDVHVATVFTASVPAPTGFALACQTDKGLAPDVDYMALRRAEDAAAMRALGATAHWLPLREAPHRGYADAPALFAGVHAGDRDAWRDVVAALAPIVRTLAPTLLLAPQALGGHADHRHVVRAVAALARGTHDDEAMLDDAAHDDPTRDSAGPDDAVVPVAWYRDTPYVLRDPDAQPPAPLHDAALGALEAWAVPLDVAALAARLDACAAYASQLGFQFGGTDAMRAALSRLAHDDAHTIAAPHAERLDARPQAARVLRAVLGARPVRSEVSGTLVAAR